MKTGKIVIDRKVYFEYYLLEKPNKDDFYAHNWSLEFPSKVLHVRIYANAMKEYEASKQLIEVSNVCRDTWLSKLYFIAKCGTKHTVHIVKNNQKCKAEVTGDKATIIELTKE